jgi:urease accessory protein
MLFYGFGVSIVGAALRLGIIQHIESQQILDSLKPIISEQVNKYISKPYDEIWQFSPQADISQMHHEKMEAKMFIT